MSGEPTVDKCPMQVENGENDDSNLIDLQCLVPTETQKVAISETLKNMVEDSKSLKFNESNETPKHPVLTLFLDQKWKLLFAIKSILIVFSLVYFLQHLDEYEEETKEQFMLICVLVVVITTLVEVCQIIRSSSNHHTYFEGIKTRPGNFCKLDEENKLFVLRDGGDSQQIDEHEKL
jgi:hypothetical protein